MLAELVIKMPDVWTSIVPETVLKPLLLLKFTRVRFSSTSGPEKVYVAVLTPRRN